MTPSHKVWRETCGFVLDDIEWKDWMGVHVWHPIFGQFSVFAECKCGAMHPIWEGLQLETGVDFWFIYRVEDEYMSRIDFERIVDEIAYSIPADEVKHLSIHLLSHDTIKHIDRYTMFEIYEQMFPSVSETELRFAKMMAYAVNQAKFAHEGAPDNGKYN